MIPDQLLPAFHQREKTIISAALPETEQLRLLELLAKIQQSAREHATTNRTAPRRGPFRTACGAADRDRQTTATPGARIAVERNSPDYETVHRRSRRPSIRRIYSLLPACADGWRQPGGVARSINQLCAGFGPVCRAPAAAPVGGTARG